MSITKAATPPLVMRGYQTGKQGEWVQASRTYLWQEPAAYCRNHMLLSITPEVSPAFMRQCIPRTPPLHKPPTHLCSCLASHLPTNRFPGQPAEARHPTVRYQNRCWPSGSPAADAPSPWPRLRPPCNPAPPPGCPSPRRSAVRIPNLNRHFLRPAGIPGVQGAVSGCGSARPRHCRYNLQHKCLATQ